MEKLKAILINKFPKLEKQNEGQLFFFAQTETVKLKCPTLEENTMLNFYKTQFFTGYRKFRVLDIVVGLSNDNEVFLLTNPIFSDKHSDLITRFEQIKPIYINQTLISEIIELYKQTEAIITEIDDYVYQIWFGEEKWRLLCFEIEGALKIKTIHNSIVLENKKKLWQRIFSYK